MKKLTKRIAPMALAICLMLTTIVGANAAAPIEPRGSAANAVFMRNGTSSYVMNALTWGTPTNGTDLSLYTKDGSDSQRFYTKDHGLYNALTASYIVGINTSDSSAEFIPVGSSSSLWRVDSVASGGGYKFELPSYGRYLGAYSLAQSNRLFFKPTTDTSYTTWIFE